MKNRLSAFIAESIVDDRSPTIHVFGGLRSPPMTAFRIGSPHFQWLLLAESATFVNVRFSVAPQACRPAPVARQFGASGLTWRQAR
jgi:hypothetical protein